MNSLQDMKVVQGNDAQQQLCHQTGLHLNLDTLLYLFSLGHFSEPLFVHPKKWER